MTLLALLACGTPPAATPSDTGADTGPASDTAEVAACANLARLELVPLDAWGHDLPSVRVAWDALPEQAHTGDDGPGVVRVPFGSAPVTLRGRLSAPEHLDATVTVAWDGQAFSFGSEGAVGTVTSVRTRADDSCVGVEVPVTSLYVLLDHAWFAAQGRAPSQNAVELFMDGEDHWAAVADDLAGAERRVTWSTWWWESAFELTRGDDPRVRAQHTIGALFEGLPDVERRVLINRFWDENTDWNAYLNTDTALRDAALRGGDRFEVMLQGNPTAVPVYEEYVGDPAPIDVVARVRANPRYADRAIEGEQARQQTSLTLQAASWHQKAMVIDGRVAWVTGMNTKQTDWDGSEHRVFDPRRMDPDASAADRADVAAELALADNAPRKDYGIRIEGPAVRDVEDVLHARWEAGLEGADLYAEHATPFVLDEAPAVPADAVPVQVVATMPAPWADESILETQRKAIRQARDYVLVEDQYFRAPLLNTELVAAMDANPDLVLLVITQPVSATDGGAKYTFLSDQLFRERYPDRYLLLQLRSAELTVEAGWWSDTVDVATEDVFLHSKLRIVDDRYLSVGSCNMNNRGYRYEGELNVAVLDTTFARAARRRVLANLVGPDWEGLLTDDARNNLDVLAMAAQRNAEILDVWAAEAPDLDDATAAEAAWESTHPSGFVFPLRIEGDYWWDVGPDAF